MVELNKHLQPQVCFSKECAWIQSAALHVCYANYWSRSVGIRLAGATNDVHVMDFPTGKWSKIEPLGELPAPRAAHAAVAVGSMMVVQVRWPFDAIGFG
jgi:hypothetical protein